MTEEYTRVREIQEDSPFYVSKLTRAILRHTNDGPELHVTLDRNEFLKAGELDSDNRSKDPWIKDLTAGKNPAKGFMEKAWKQFSKGKDVPIATGAHPVRWLGAGGILVVKDRYDLYAVINKREGSKVWNDRYDANGGMSSSIEEMLHPTRLAERELGEELLIDSKPADDYDLKRLVPSKTWRVVTTFKGQTFSENRFIFTPDAATGTLDLRVVKALKVKNMDKLTFGDGETIHARDNSQIKTSRPVFVFRLSDIFGVFVSSHLVVKPIRGFRNGEVMGNGELASYEVSADTLTPTLRDMLLALKNDVDFSQLD